MRALVTPPSTSIDKADLWLQRLAEAILGTMIPTMILLGFVVGRWWKIALPLVAVGWPLTLIASGVIDLDAADVVGAAIFGVANAAVGAGVFLAIQGGVRIVTRSLRRS